MAVLNMSLCPQACHDADDLFAVTVCMESTLTLFSFFFFFNDAPVWFLFYSEQI